MENASNTPSLRFRGYTDAWGQERLGDICSITKGSGLSKENLEYEGANKCVLYGHLYTDYGFFIKDVHWGTNVLPDNPIYSEVGDVLVPGSDTTPTGCARAASIDVSGVLLGGDINVFKHSDNIDGDFLSLSINHERPAMISMIKGTSVRHLTGKDLRDLAVKFPKEVKEQRCISSVFIKLDSLLSLHQRKLDKLQAIKKSLLQKMFPAEGEDRPQIRFAGYTDAWGQERLGDMGETFTGLSGKSKEDFGHGNAKFVTYMNVYLNPIADLKMLESVEVDNKQTKVQYGDMFFTTSSETPEEVGMSSIWLGNIENLYLNSFCFGYRLSKKMDPYFMGYLMRSPEIRNKFIFLAQGISRYNISKNHVMEMEVAFPSLEEQKKIGQLLYSVDSLLSLHQRKLEKLQQIKKALLEQMFC